MSGRVRDGKERGLRFVLLVEFDHGAWRRRERCRHDHMKAASTHENGVSFSTDIDDNSFHVVHRNTGVNCNAYCNSFTKMLDAELNFGRVVLHRLHTCTDTCIYRHTHIYNHMSRNTITTFLYFPLSMFATLGICEDRAKFLQTPDE